MPNIQYDVDIQGVSMSYGKNTILNQIDLQIKQGELLTLLGPSGCGKSTTLNIIAGFLHPDQGELLIKGKKMNNVPSYKRDLGMVFQAYSLFPHMTVYENLAFGLKLRKIDKQVIAQKIEKALALVKMTGLEQRYPRELSGGQRQRVAIARALVVEPTLLLLDEPLSNLDAKLRVELRAEIKRMQKDVGVTTVFVTHDQDEALSMSDRIVVMNAGKIEQIGTPTEIYQNPASEFVFQFIGSSNCLEGTVTSIENEEFHIRINEKWNIQLPKDSIIGNAQIGVNDEVKLYIRPEQIHVGSSVTEKHHELTHLAKIVQMNYLGSAWEVEVLIEGEYAIKITCPEMNPAFAVGNEVVIGWKQSDMRMTKKS
ncbi:ABC transporter ATP-binding protein [Bacillus sp. S/N-304-OC-R1]|uniref:ABC transporter ATP-binding protein n=1 Tax=Bacillus sp. S/N-304-OC-R1 TaxID=2758034 RepID=UPI001C8DDB5E|nr:ABC transporter ATP-binding protein [Bacillus sp. S/N-304-OC-R1]MBY0121124.1 ABC transporter ATP-binding protein [Bacillus sp. S/N-304-OC-R1]